MSAFWILLVVSWIVIIIWPQIIAYILGWLLLFFWLNILFLKYVIFFKSKNKNEGYVKFWNYKIYKD